MSNNLGTYEFVGSGYREYSEKGEPISQEAYDLTDRMMEEWAEPQVNSLTKATVAKIVEAGRDIQEGEVKTVHVDDAILAGSPGIESEHVEIHADGQVSFVGELEMNTPLRMSFDFENALPHMIALYDATKDQNVDLKQMAGAVSEQELGEIVNMLEEENIENPDLKGHLVWINRKTGKVYEGASERPSPITHLATLDDEPTTMTVEEYVENLKKEKRERDQKPGLGFN